MAFCQLWCYTEKNCWLCSALRLFGYKFDCITLISLELTNRLAYTEVIVSANFLLEFCYKRIKFSISCQFIRDSFLHYSLHYFLILCCEGVIRYSTGNVVLVTLYKWTVINNGLSVTYKMDGRVSYITKQPVHYVNYPGTFCQILPFKHHV